MYYWELNAPSVYRGICTHPGSELTPKAQKHFGVLGKMNSKGECTEPYITTKKPKIELKPPKVGGDK